MGQKDQDGYYAEMCHIFFNFGVWINQYKNIPDQKKKYLVHYFVYKSFLVNKIGLGTLGGPPRGWEPRILISRGKQKILIETLCPQPPWGAP